MIITVEKESTEPLYQQLRRQVVEAIASGVLVAGDHLPSVRALAAQLGVNMHTVHKAYALLADEGFLTMRGSRGAFVADRPKDADHGDLTALHDALEKAAVEWRARGGEGPRFLETAQAVAQEVFSPRTREVGVLAVEKDAVEKDGEAALGGSAAPAMGEGRA